MAERAEQLAKGGDVLVDGCPHPDSDHHRCANRINTNSVG
jgi:hypothetical protein